MNRRSSHARALGGWAVVLVLLVEVCVAMLAVPGAVRAQDDRAEARERFARGVELLEEGRHAAALAELQRAYALHPSTSVLFALAEAHAALGQAVEAVDALERLLAESGDSLSAAHRAAAEDELARQRARVAHVAIESDVAGAVVSVDGADVGTTPLSEPVRVSAGEHVVALRAEGYVPVRRRIRVAGLERPSLRFELVASDAPRAMLSIRSPVPGVEVLLDDRSLGVTPFDAPVPIATGRHRLVARRPGYLPHERAFEVGAGDEVAIDLAMRADPDALDGTRGTLVLQLPDAEWRGTLDGARIPRGRTELEVPIGPHDLRLEVERRRPVELRVEVPIAATATVRPVLEWTPEASAEGHAALDAQHTAGVAVVVAGGVLVAAGLSAFVINRDDWERLDTIGAICADAASPACGALWMGRYPDFATFQSAWSDDRRVRAGIDMGAVIGVAVGAAFLVTGTALLIATPSHGAFERSASARVELGVGAGSVLVRGAF